MKYKLLKDLPLAKAGTEVTYKDEGLYPEIFFNGIAIGYIPHNLPEWLEEVKEAKTIYDLKEGDKYWNITFGSVSRMVLAKSGLEFIKNTDDFLTEREAKRNKLLRELATRTTKYLPKKGEMYMNLYGSTREWIGSVSNNFEYHCGLIFKDKEELERYIGIEENKLLLHL